MPASNGTARPLSHPPVPDSVQEASSSRTVPRSSNGAPSSDTSYGTGQAASSAAYLSDFLLKLSACTTIGEALKLLPVPVQPVSRDVLDGVYQASLKLGGAEALLLFWKDRLRSGVFDGVSQLNSLRAPVVQVCKEATGPDDGGLSAMNLDATLHKAKEAALTAMVAIKEQEVANLRSFVQPHHIRIRLQPLWEGVVTQHAATITTEHQSLLAHEGVVRKVCQVAASIGESASQRARISKEKRTVVRREADVDMTDVSSGSSKKQLASVVEEVLKRREQSRRDRAQSGKGKRSSGISKKQKKTPKKQDRPKKKKGGPTNNKKGPNTRRRQARR